MAVTRVIGGQVWYQHPDGSFQTVPPVGDYSTDPFNSPNNVLNLLGINGTTANGGVNGSLEGTPANASGYYQRRLNSLLDNPDSIQNSGVYKFQMQQGQQALERSAAAKGMTGSGNTLQALMAYGQGNAAQAYNTEADRLAGLAKSEYDLEGAKYKSNAALRSDQGANVLKLFQLSGAPSSTQRTSSFYTGDKYGLNSVAGW